MSSTKNDRLGLVGVVLLGRICLNTELNRLIFCETKCFFIPYK